jgi:hypothetical protein
MEGGVSFLCRKSHFGGVIFPAGRIRKKRVYLSRDLVRPWSFESLIFIKGP